jgi:hypothetical protein
MKYSIVAFVIALGLGYYLGTSYGAKTEVKTVEKEIVKTDVVTRIVETERPDGSKSKETTIVDRSRETKKSSATITVSAPPPANRVGISALFNEPREYELRYERRLAGPLWLGISANTKQVYGVSVAYEF